MHLSSRVRFDDEMGDVRLALLNASEDANTPRNFRRELDAELAEFRVRESQLPPTFEFDGCVVTGSRSSVYWDDEWLPPLREWIEGAIDRDIPFLGICYGHQLLADVLGGTVETMGEYELGYQLVRHDGESVLLDGIDGEFLVFTSHSDRVTQLPPGATQFAENEFGIHGFRDGRVFGVQFHPEYDQETARGVTEGKDIDAAWKEEILADITDERYAEACQAKQLFGNFVEFVASTRAPPPPAD